MAALLDFVFLNFSQLVFARMDAIGNGIRGV